MVCAAKEMNQKSFDGQSLLEFSGFSLESVGVSECYFHIYNIFLKNFSSVHVFCYQELFLYWSFLLKAGTSSVTQQFAKDSAPSLL